MIRSSIIGGFKFTYDSKIKPLILLIVCICFFVSASCIYATDVDDDVACIQCTIEDGIDDNLESLPNIMEDENPNQDTSDGTGSSAADSNGNHSSQAKNKTHFSHGDKRLNRNVTLNANSHSKDPFANKHSVDKHPIDDATRNAKSQHAREISDHRQYASYESQLSQETCHQDAARSGSEKTIIKTDAVSQIYANNTDAFRKAAGHDSGLTQTSELCRCGDCQCGHRCSHHCDEEIHASRIPADALISNDLTYSYNYFYTQINTASEGLIRYREVDEEELMDEQTRRSANIPVFVYTHDAITSDDLTNQSEPSHMDFDAELTDSLYGNVTQFDSIGLNIDGLYALDLDIKDYNLEYYMFSNPDIIITADLQKANTLIFNTDFYHCPENADAKNTSTHYLIFNHELSCISEDDYADFYRKALSLLDDNENTLMLIRANSSRHSPVNLSDDGCAFSLNFGGIERCLI